MPRSPSGAVRVAQLRSGGKRGRPRPFPRENNVRRGGTAPTPRQQGHGREVDGGDEARRELVRSLKTSDPVEAAARLQAAERAALADLDARLAGRATEKNSVAHYRALAELASAMGVVYQPSTALAQEPIDAILKRVRLAGETGGEVRSQAVGALLGTVEPPQRTMSEMAQQMEAVLHDEVQGKNPRQLRIWRNQWTRAAVVAAEALGRDPEIEALRDEDSLTVQEHMRTLVSSGAISRETANKMLTYMSKITTTHYRDVKRKSPPMPFRGLALEDKWEHEKRKPELGEDWVRDVLHDPTALSWLNPEARDMLLIMSETGCGGSEIGDTPPGAIRLDDEIPHIEVAVVIEGRHQTQVKNRHRIRRVPLVGVALDAARRHPDGFPRYRGKAGFSAVANKYLRGRGLLPDGHSVGGLRHGFESRLKAIGIASDDRGELMGHSVKRARGCERYGDAMSLERKCEIHERIMVTPPLRLPAPEPDA